MCLYACVTLNSTVCSSCFLLNCFFLKLFPPFLSSPFVFSIYLQYFLTFFFRHYFWWCFVFYFLQIEVYTLFCHTLYHMMNTIVLLPLLYNSLSSPAYLVLFWYCPWLCFFIFYIFSFFLTQAFLYSFVYHLFDQFNQCWFFYHSCCFNIFSCFFTDRLDTTGKGLILYLSHRLLETPDL